MANETGRRHSIPSVSESSALLEDEPSTSLPQAASELEDGPAPNLVGLSSRAESDNGSIGDRQTEGPGSIRVEDTQPGSPDPPKAQASSRPGFITRAANDTFLWETLCLVLSMSCLVGAAVMLKVYDGKVLPDWPYGITLNATLSLLSTIMTSAMIVPIAAGISQLKWLWFVTGPKARNVKARPLSDFGEFDSASRGPWGCLLLVKTAWKS